MSQNSAERFQVAHYPIFMPRNIWSRTQGITPLKSYLSTGITPWSPPREQQADLPALSATDQIHDGRLTPSPLGAGEAPPWVNLHSEKPSVGTRLSVPDDLVDIWCPYMGKRLPAFMSSVLGNRNPVCAQDC